MLKKLINRLKSKLFIRSARSADVHLAITIKLPFIYKNKGFCKNKKGLFLDEHKLTESLSINADTARRLAKFFNDGNFKQKIRLYKPKINRKSLARIYKQLIDGGLFNSQAELAIGLGVSRAWITKVMNELKLGPIE